jgi:hypothetical protein
MTEPFKKSDIKIPRRSDFVKQKPRASIVVSTSLQQSFQKLPNERAEKARLVDLRLSNCRLDVAFSSPLSNLQSQF